METVVFDGSQPVTPVGHYTYRVHENDWSWSDGVYLMHGYEPREVPATTEVLLLHKHPDDRSRAAGVLDAAVRDGNPFSCYHRIIDRHEHIRNVLSVGRGIQDPTGSRTRRGLLRRPDQGAPRRNRSRGPASYGGDRPASRDHRPGEGHDHDRDRHRPKTAFATLRRYSQNTNIKLHDVAQRLVDAADGHHHQAGWVIEFLDGLPRA